MYAKDITKLKYRDIFTKKDPPNNDSIYKYLELKNGERRNMTTSERKSVSTIPKVHMVILNLKVVMEKQNLNLMVKYLHLVKVLGKHQ